MRRIKAATIVCALLFLPVTGFCIQNAPAPAAVPQARTSPAPIDLSKDDSVTLLKIQFQVESMVRARDQFIEGLHSKYKLEPTEWQLDISSCKFTPIPPPKQPKEQIK